MDVWEIQDRLIEEEDSSEIAQLNKLYIMQTIIDNCMNYVCDPCNVEKFTSVDMSSFCIDNYIPYTNDINGGR